MKYYQHKRTKEVGISRETNAIYRMEMPLGAEKEIGITTDPDWTEITRDQYFKIPQPPIWNSASA